MIYIIIPVLNPDKLFIQVLKSLKEKKISNIIVVNDGSKKECNKYFEIAEKEYNAIVLSHSVNRGKGRALKTAFEYVMVHKNEAKGVITIDADNQHHIDDIVNILNRLEKNSENLILGTRNFKQKGIPLRSRVGNLISIFVYYFLGGVKVSDTQTGLRGIPTRYLNDLVYVPGERYEYETNMLLYTKNSNVSIDEIKIKTIYIDNNETSYFNPIVDSFKIYKQIFKYASVSIVSFLIDYILFVTLIFVLSNLINEAKILIILSTIIARITSSIFNFLSNKKIVFKSESNLKTAAIRYYALVLAQGLLSGILLYLVNSVVNANIYVFKIIIDIFLFMISYYVQKVWVFDCSNKFNLKKFFKQGNRSNVKKIILKSLKMLSVVIVSLVIFCTVFVFGTSYILLKGPSPKLSQVFAISLYESSVGGVIPDLILNDKEIKSIKDNNKIITLDELTDTETAFKNNENLDLTVITVEEVSGSTFKGKMLIINDPSRVSVSTIDEFGRGLGKPVEYLVIKEDGVAGINGGRFFDNGQGGMGGEPLGVLIKDGKILKGEDTKDSVVGFNENNKLIVGNMTGKEAIELGIRDGLSFGPILITNGKPATILGNGSGLNPRTVIGQREDGAVLMLVIDGRQSHSLGASLKDCLEIMLEYKAINAMNLDGGTSSTLYYNGEVISNRANLFGERPVPTAFIVK